MVCTVAGDGAPRSLSVVRSSGVCWTRPFPFSDSSLVELRPFLLLLFHPARALCAFFICGSSLSLAVLAGLLPQVTTYDHRFNFVDFMQLHLVLKHICSKPIFFKFNRLSILVANNKRNKSTFNSFKNLQHLPPYGTSVAFPFGRLTCVLSASPTSP